MGGDGDGGDSGDGGLGAAAAAGLGTGDSGTSGNIGIGGNISGSATDGAAAAAAAGLGTGDSGTGGNIGIGGDTGVSGDYGGGIGAGIGGLGGLGNPGAGDYGGVSSGFSDFGGFTGGFSTFGEPGSLAAQADAQAGINAFGFSGLTAMGFNFADVSSPTAADLSFAEEEAAIPTSLAKEAKEAGKGLFGIAPLGKAPPGVQVAQLEEKETNPPQLTVPKDAPITTETLQEQPHEPTQFTVVISPQTNPVDATVTGKVSGVGTGHGPSGTNAPASSAVGPDADVSAPAIAEAPAISTNPVLGITTSVWGDMAPTAITGPAINEPVNAVPGFPAGIGVTPTQSMPDIGVTSTPAQLSTGTYGGISLGTSVYGSEADTASQLGMPNVPQSVINAEFGTLGATSALTSGLSKGKSPAAVGIPTTRGEAMENEAIQAVKGVAPKGMPFGYATPIGPQSSIPPNAMVQRGFATIGPPAVPALNPLLGPQSQTSMAIQEAAEDEAKALQMWGPIGTGAAPPASTPSDAVGKALSALFGISTAEAASINIPNPLGTGLGGYGGYGGHSQVPGEGTSVAVGSQGGGLGGGTGGVGAGQSAIAGPSVIGVDDVFGIPPSSLVGYPQPKGPQAPVALPNPFSWGPQMTKGPLAGPNPNPSDLGQPALGKGNNLGTPNVKGGVANPNVVSPIPITPTEPAPKAPPLSKEQQEQVAKAKADLAKDLKERAERAEKEKAEQIQKAKDDLAKDLKERAEKAKAEEAKQEKEKAEEAKPPPKEKEKAEETKPPPKEKEKAEEAKPPLPKARPEEAPKEEAKPPPPVVVAKPAPPPVVVPLERAPPPIVDTPLTRETQKDVEKQIEAHPIVTPPAPVAAPPTAVVAAPPAVPPGTLGTGITGFTPGGNINDWINQDQGRRIAVATNTPVTAVSAMQALSQIPINPIGLTPAQMQQWWAQQVA